MKGNVLTYCDYYPFGMQMPGRSFNADAYRYGFQGQEKDDEVNRNDALDGVEDKGVNLENNDVIFLDKPIDITDDSEREVTEEDKTGTIHVDFGVYE